MKIFIFFVVLRYISCYTLALSESCFHVLTIPSNTKKRRMYHSLPRVSFEIPAGHSMRGRNESNGRQQGTSHTRICIGRKRFLSLDDSIKPAGGKFLRYRNYLVCPLWRSQQLLYHNLRNPPFPGQYWDVSRIPIFYFSEGSPAGT